jgi:hypothetical protein
MSDYRPGLDRALHAARTAGVEGKRCTMCIVIAHAKPGVVQDTLTGAAAGTLSVRALHRALRESGVRIERMAIQHHRNEGHTP